MENIPGATGLTRKVGLVKIVLVVQEADEISKLFGRSFVVSKNYVAILFGDSRRLFDVRPEITGRFGCLTLDLGFVFEFGDEIVYERLRLVLGLFGNRIADSLGDDSGNLLGDLFLVLPKFVLRAVDLDDSLCDLLGLPRLDGVLGECGEEVRLLDESYVKPRTDP
ncbi:hypothetical protein [Halorussus ruber]|uniref:hypothetical protein n=1 Tax=Halorussus ruber TaxID=1126238 RepID=UPI00109270B2|nr:hypothetical protein [Halorussus ruber]